MPVNPMSGRAGNITRCLQLLKYFESNSNYLQTWFVSFDNWTKIDMAHFEQQFPNIKLILIQHREKKENYLKYLFNDKFLRLFLRKGIDQVTPFNSKQLKKNLKGIFDISLISYVDWGSFSQFIQSKYTIIDTHDFMTSQYVRRNGDRKVIGKVFQEEIEILNRVDEVWTYSIEEQYIFEQFLTNKISLLPISLNVHLESKMKLNRIYEVLYVASDNDHNIKSISWFVQEVLPLIDKKFSMAVVGKICEKIQDNSRITKLGVVNDLAEVYNSSKITICPMLSGTGIKIKVLESLSFGIPVVTTRRGVDGLINKVSNGCLVAETAKQFAFYINKLLIDTQFYNRIKIQGVDFYNNNYALDNEIKILDDCFLRNRNATGSL